MKQLFYSALALLLVSCSGKMSIVPEDEGVKNAKQFVIEKYNINQDNIESIEGEVQDSLFGTIHLSFANLEMAKAAQSYAYDEMSKKEFMHISDSLFYVLHDAEMDWKFNGMESDSIRRHEKYKYCLRKVVKVTINFKSGTFETKRVLMDNDGKTPNLTEDQYFKQLTQWMVDHKQMSEIWK